MASANDGLHSALLAMLEAIKSRASSEARMLRSTKRWIKSSRSCGIKTDSAHGSSGASAKLSSLSLLPAITKDRHGFDDFKVLLADDCEIMRLLHPKPHFG